MEKRGRMSTGGHAMSVAKKGAASRSRSLEDAGVQKAFEGLEPTTKAFYVASVTDTQLEKKASQSEKDQVELVAPGADRDAMYEKIHMDCGYSCIKGFKPESANQDSFSVIVVEGKFAMYGVYDGHGPEGHFASDMSLRNLVKTFMEHPKREGQPDEALKEVFMETQKMLKTQKEHEFSSSGTTCTIAYHDLSSDFLTIAHVGDSRAVLGCVNGRKVDVLSLTVDHKPDLPQEKARIESANPPGRVIFDGYFNHRVFSQKGMYPGLNMSRALGDLVAHSEAGLTAEPEITSINLKAERNKVPDQKLVLLVATDGVWEFIESKEAVELLYSKEAFTTPQKAVDKLTKTAYDRWMKDSDGEITDDISAILVHI